MNQLRFKSVLKNVFIWQDSEFLRVTRSHPDVVSSLFHSKKITKIEQEEWYEGVYQQDPNFRIYIAFNTKFSKPVGYVQFHIDSLIHRRCEVGYVVSPNFYGNGYGDRMVKWSINWAIGQGDDIHRLFLTVFPENKKAIHIYEKNGFVKESLMKDYVFKDGKYRDVVLMVMLLENQSCQDVF